MGASQRLNAALDGGDILLDVVGTGQAHDGMDDRERILGTVIDFASEAEAREFARNDPYTKEGVFERVEVRPFRRVVP